MSEYTFSFQGRPVDAVRHGRQLTLKDCSIKAKSSLILIKMGFVLDITNPKVCSLNSFVISACIISNNNPECGYSTFQAGFLDCACI